MALIDYSKAFNRQSHNRLVTCFSDLGTPNYLLKVLTSYLWGRKMVVRHMGVTSECFDMHAGSPQGTNLGVLCYLVSINSCGVPLDSIEDYIKNCINQVEKMHPVLPLPQDPITEEEARFKYMDDMSLCHAVNLKDLQEINWPIENPVNFRDRTMHHLPILKNKLQETMNNVHKFSQIQNFCSF